MKLLPYRSFYVIKGLKAHSFYVINKVFYNSFT